MKYFAFILFFSASSAFAGGEKVVWTSDTTYVQGGVEYWDPIESARKVVNEWLIDEETGTATPGDIEGAEYNMNPINSPRNDMWMYCYTDWC